MLLPVLLSRGGHTSVGADRGDEGFDAEKSSKKGVCR